MKIASNYFEVNYKFPGKTQFRNQAKKYWRKRFICFFNLTLVFNNPFVGAFGYLSFRVSCNKRCIHVPYLPTFRFLYQFHLLHKNSFRSVVRNRNGERIVLLFFFSFSFSLLFSLFLSDFVSFLCFCIELWSNIE